LKFMSFVPLNAVAELVCRWAVRRMPAGGFVPRLNLRLIFGSSDLANEVRRRLEPTSSAAGWYVVRTSADPDAVTCRNNRPTERPPGVTDATPLLYLLFWLPNAAGHEKNKESLADLKATTCWDLLADAEGFVLPEEEVIAKRCAEAAAAWAKPDLAAAHLRGAWSAVRTSVREGRGGREGTLPFFADLESYLRFLDCATTPAEEWAATAQADRAGKLVERWGSSLPALSMFHAPELASLLGVTTDPTVSVTKRDQAETWKARLTDLLSDNLEAASDFSQLADKIAGKSTVARQLDLLKGQVDLCRKGAGDKRTAREALEQFCHDGDPRALELVQWQFHDDPGNRKTRSHGLRGVLIARRTSVRVPPQDRAIQETLGLLHPLLQEGADRDAIASLVERDGQAAVKDSNTARRLADFLRSLAAGQVPSWVADPVAKEALERLTRSGQVSPPAFDQVAARWDKLAGGEGDEVISAPSLLLGLARLCAARLTKDATDPVLFPGGRPAPEEQLALRVPAAGDGKGAELKLPIGQWDEQTREKIRLWLRDTVLSALDSEEADEGEGEEEGESGELQVDVRREGGRSPGPLGSIVLSWSPRGANLVGMTGRSLASWQLDEGVATGNDWTLLSQLFQEEPKTESCPEAVATACQAYLKALKGVSKQWAVASLVGPAPTAARGWVEEWAKSLDLGSGEAVDPVRLMEQAFAALEAGRMEEAAELKAKAKAASAATTSLPAPSVQAVKALLRVATGGVGVSRLALTPHHPLVVRLRVLGDDLLMQILGHMWTGGWPESAVEELQEAVDDWGWPEPLQFYKHWTGQEPLAFEGWVRDVGFAWFGQRGRRLAADPNAPGVNEVAYDVRRYRELFPMAADRLRMRFRADPDGRWAARVLDGVARSGDSLKADIDLETDVTADGSTAIETAWRLDYERRRALEMSDDGTPARVRVRRRPPSERESAHLNVVSGDAVEAFTEQVELNRPDPPRLRTWDLGVFFTPPRPELRPDRFLIGDPSDELCRRVGQAVAFVHSESRDSVFVRQCAYDPAVVRKPVEDLHDGTHWLILASRQPLHRAVQQAGEEVASLLDFRTAVDRGRTVHVCVSVGTRQFGGDMARLEGMLRLLTGDKAATGKAVVHAARRFAPRLALSCAGASSLTEVEGLVGLLLTQAVLRAEPAPGLLLSLDQHRRLLTGRGRRGDIVRLRLDGSTLSIGVVESKLSLKSVTADHSVVEDSREQLRTTRERLKHFTALHPLVPRVRSSLARAIADQIHLSEAGADGTGDLTRLLDAAHGSGTRVQLDPDTSAVAHVWSFSPDTKNQTLEDAGKARVEIHGRDETLEQFRKMLGSPV
jgi:hypothetical protein